MKSNRINVVLNHLKGNESNRHLLNSTSADEFRYTLPNSSFSYDQRMFYEENGFIVFPNLIDHALLDECRDKFVDLCTGRASKGSMTLMRDISLSKRGAEGEFLYNKVQDIVWDEVFSKYILHPNVLNIVENFTGPNISAVHSMLINKPPDSGEQTSQHPLHQDLHYFPFRPADRIVASWTAMERVTANNGCLFVLPGSHKGALQPHDYPETKVNKMYHGIIGYDQYPKVNLEMEKGDTVFFHPLIIHGSGVNVTKGFRKAISCHYASSDCYYIDVRGTTQENIAKEIEGVSRRKGLELGFVDIWKLRSRVVRGMHGTINATL